MNSAKPISVSSTAELFPASFFFFIADLISTTKPGVMSLLLISTVCPMVLAGGWDVSITLMLWVLLGGALVSGSASAMNCIWDRDIDSVMHRTIKRPIVSGRVSTEATFTFSFFIGLAGLLILGYAANPYAAAISLFGHFFYVFIYTIWLKRTTPQNIVIGGAAGAVPPMVGWVAVTGNLDLTAILLFLIVFLWTPPHFWALAINKNADYQRANIPMLPVESGDRRTIKEMFWYSIALIPCSLLLVAVNDKLGILSYLVFSAIGLIFSWKIFDLMKNPDISPELKTKKAWSIFGFSLIHLALFFFCIVVDALIN